MADVHLGLHVSPTTGAGAVLDSVACLWIPMGKDMPNPAVTYVPVWVGIQGIPPHSQRRRDGTWGRGCMRGRLREGCERDVK